MARPSTFTDEIASLILSRLAQGETLTSICAPDDMPDRTTVWRWTEAHEAFRNAYARARIEQAHALADECLDIADASGFDAKVDKDGNVQLDGEAIGRARLRVDTRKWLASKIAPRLYGDKIAIGGDDDMPPIQTEVTDVDAARRAAFLLQRAQRGRPGRTHVNGDGRDGERPVDTESGSSD